MGPAMRAVLESGCTYCAGEGRVTTKILRMFAGVGYPQPIIVRDCPHCGGSGLEPEPQRGYA